jgi:hypothetical protein
MTQKHSPQQRAKLRVCMSCEWIFEGDCDCPRCGWASYGARFVFGDKAYRYKVTQQPWMDRKLTAYKSELWLEIMTAQSA